MAPRRTLLAALFTLCAAQALATPPPRTHRTHGTRHRASGALAESSERHGRHRHRVHAHHDATPPHAHAAPASTHRARAIDASPAQAPAFSPTAPRPAVGTRSVGCEMRVPVPTGVSEQSLFVRGVRRHYLLYVPEHYDPRAAPRRLVFAFHGRTGTPRSLRGYLRLEAEAGESAIFVYPAGLRVEPASGGRSLTEWQIGRNGEDYAFFDQLLDRIGETYCIDRGQVFAVGHSAGAVVTNDLGCARGNVLRAIAPIAGMGPDPSRCTEAPPVWITHGRNDGLVPFQGLSTRDRWIRAAGCAADDHGDAGAPCERYAQCTGSARVEFCPHDGRHDPPSFAPHAIWTFFNESVARASAPAH